MIYVSDKAKEKVRYLMEESPIADKSGLFLRVSVIGGGCSGLSYKMDFDNQKKPMDQEFEDNGVKVVTDLKSFLYLVNTTLEFSEGLNGKGFYFDNHQLHLKNLVRKMNGIRGMKERAELLSGTFNINAEPGKGTILQTEIPL